MYKRRKRPKVKLPMFVNEVQRRLNYKYTKGELKTIVLVVFDTLTHFLFKDFSISIKNFGVFRNVVRKPIIFELPSKQKVYKKLRLYPTFRYTMKFKKLLEEKVRPQEDE